MQISSYPLKQAWQTLFITNDSTVYYDIVAHLNFRCFMKFDYFPMDVNICPFKMEVLSGNAELSLENLEAKDTESFKNEPFEIGQVCH